MSTIMQVLPSLISGGVEKGTIEIAKSLVANGFQSIVLSSGGSLVTELEKYCPHITLNVQSKNPFNMWRNIQAISQMLKEHNVDIIHARSRAPAWSCYYAAKKSEVKFITTVHGIYKANNFLKQFYNNVMTKGDRVISVSNFVRQYLLEHYKVDESKVRVIPRGVNSEIYDSAKLTEDKLAKFRNKYNIPANVPIMLLPGRFSSWKGQKLLVEAINKIKHLNFYCLMVGDISKHPEYVQKVKSMIYSMKLQSKIQIFGSENDMFNLYGISDIIFSTSTEPEAFGRTIIEAQSMQKLVIASNIGGASETIENEKTGLHFISFDSGDLADKITYALKIINTAKHLEIVSNARQSVIENYSLHAMQQKTLDVYKELL